MLNHSKAIHTWSLFRVLGSYAAPGTMPALEGRATDPAQAVALLDLPALLASHDFASAQLCHFSLPSTDPAYLEELRSAFVGSGVDLECFLVDHGDLADPREGARWADWISDWITVGEALGAGKVRISAGDQAPSETTIAHSAAALRSLADRHEGTRILVENWQSLLVNAEVTLDLLERCEGRIGFLADFGNWKGPGKYDELAQVAARAESCQAKVSTGADGGLDVEDFRACLDIMESAAYSGPLSLVYDGTEQDVWTMLDQAHAQVREKA